MKLEVEITEEEIKSAIERKIRVAIADSLNNYSMDLNIKEVIKKHLTEAIDVMVREEIANSDKLKEKVQEALTNKIKAQLTKLMKEGK